MAYLLCKQNDIILHIKLFLLFRREVRESIELDFESEIDVCPPYKLRKDIEAEATSLADHEGAAIMVSLEV